VLSGSVVMLVLSCEKPTSQSASKLQMDKWVLYSSRLFSTRSIRKLHVGLISMDEIDDTGSASLMVYVLVMSPDFVTVLKKVRKQDVAL
jgi:hypothetical protein